jgi:tRNA-binding EMAP/Myf-like protein
MEQLDVLGFYFKKFDILSSKVIAALVNIEVGLIKNRVYHKNAEKDIKKLKLFLQKIKIFSDQEIEALLVIFIK